MTGYDEERVASTGRSYFGSSRDNVSAVTLYDEDRERAIIRSPATDRVSRNTSRVERHP